MSDPVARPPRETPDLEAIEARQRALREAMGRPPGVTTLRQEFEAHHVGPMLGLLDRAEACEADVLALLAEVRRLRAAPPAREMPLNPHHRAHLDAILRLETTFEPRTCDTCERLLRAFSEWAAARPAGEPG